MVIDSKPKIVNIVSTGQLPVKKLDLEKLYQTIEFNDIEYEPESYPGLLGKTKDPRGHVTLYRNGKYIITGVDSEEKLNKVYYQMIEALKQINVF